MNKIVWSLLFSFALAMRADAASFDCSKSATNVEKLICGNEELSRLDERLSESYKKSLQRADIKKMAIESQRQWTKNVRDPCGAVDCIKTAYEARIKEIELMSSFGIVILSKPLGKGAAPSARANEVGQPQGISAASSEANTVKAEAPHAIQPCLLPAMQNASNEDGVVQLIEAVQEKVKQKQYECVLQGMEQAHALIQSMSDGAKRAELGFELKDILLPAISSNELSDKGYEKRLIYAATQSLNDDWTPNIHASEDERFNDTAFLGRVSDHYGKESQSGIFEQRSAALKKLYPVYLAMLRMNFTLPEHRRWAESWRMENFFNITYRQSYLDDVHGLWLGLPDELRRDNQKRLSQGVLQATAGHVMSGYVLLSPDEAKKNIEAVRDLLAYTPQEPIGWQTHLYLAEAYWQTGDKKLAHDHLEKARTIAKGSQLLAIAKYLCNRMENGTLLHRCPYGIYTRSEMAALLGELEGLAETDRLIKYKIDDVKWMRKELSDGGAQ